MNAHFEPALSAEPRPHDEPPRTEEPAISLSIPASEPDIPYERSSYRRARGGDPVATAGALLLGLGTVIAFATLHPSFVVKEKRQPTIVVLNELPDDPPPAPPPEAPPPPPDAPPPEARIVAPTPVIALPERPVLAAPPAAQPVVAPAPRPAEPTVAPRAPESLGDISARVVFKPPMPRPPRESQRLHEEGTVLLAVLLGIDGRVADISVARSSGYPRLDRTALDWVRDWRWSPFLQDGTPVMVRGMVPIGFQGPRHGGRGGRHGGRRHDRDGDDRFDDGGPGPVGDPI